MKVHAPLCAATFHAAEDLPDWPARSVLPIEAGYWNMRNGHVARIASKLDIPYKDVQTGEPKVWTIWKGECLDCKTPMTWCLNGCYAAIGRHRNDLISRADPLPPSIGEIFRRAEVDA